MTAHPIFEETGKDVFAEISRDNRHIEIYFRRSSPKGVNRMHSLGADFVGELRAKDGMAHWRIDLDFWAARDMSRKIGGEEFIALGERLEAWGKAKVDIQEAVDEIRAHEGEHELPNLRSKLPDLADALHVGPKGKSMSRAEFREALKGPSSFQTTDVRLMEVIGNPLNANYPGTGKTLELIGYVFEADLENGAHLVVAPQTSLKSVWETELEEWQELPIFRAGGEGMPPKKRAEAMRNADLAYKMGRPFWLLVNPEMVRYKKRDPLGGVRKSNLYPPWPFLFEAKWSTVTLDEIQKNAVRHLQTVTAKGMVDLPREVSTALSGTPAGGKTINLFGPLHWLGHADGNMYKWAEKWLQTEDAVHSVTYNKETRTKEVKTHIEIGEVREDRADDYEVMMGTVMIRRSKEEALPWLPPKLYVPVACEMHPEQAAQYEKFAKLAEIELEDYTLTATNILSIYTRLKQFASAKQMFDGERLMPTSKSGKLSALMENLDMLGILDKQGTAQAVVASQFERMVHMYYDELVRRKVPTLMITGKNPKQHYENRALFQDAQARVMCLTTDAGGVSITLDNADTVHIMDEKWDPDDQEQVEDRTHRGSRIHQVTCYYYRTDDTIDYYIKSVTDEKGRVNKKLLNLRRVKLYRGQS